MTKNELKSFLNQLALQVSPPGKEHTGDLVKKLGDALDLIDTFQMDVTNATKLWVSMNSSTRMLSSGDPEPALFDELTRFLSASTQPKAQVFICAKCQQILAGGVAYFPADDSEESCGACGQKLPTTGEKL